MKKFVALALACIVMAPTAAIAMGSGDKFSDAQTGLTYSVYKPSNSLGLKVSDFTLNTCQPGKEEWVYVRYGGSTRYLEIMQTMAAVKCSDPGISKYLRVALINGVKAKVYVYCDPSKPATYKKCSVNDIARLGGYLMFTTKAIKGFKGTEIQVQGMGGITYAQLLTVAKAMKTVKASGVALPEAFPPEVIDPFTTTQVTVHTGGTVVLAVGDAENWGATFANPAIAEFVPGGNQGSYVTNASIHAIKAGITMVHLTHGTESYDLELTVTG